MLTLGHSRKALRLLPFRSSSRIWAELHEKAFCRLGGSTRGVVLDNLREGVLVPDIYDSSLNLLYRDVLAHDGAVALPCRIKDPDRRNSVVLPRGFLRRQVDFPAPTSRTASENMTVMEEAIEHGGDGCAVTQQFAPVVDGSI